MIGIRLQLWSSFDATAADSTGVQALWWDTTDPLPQMMPTARVDSATTDIDGYINLDLTDLTSLEFGEYGFLILYKLDVLDHEESPVFAGKVQISNLSTGTSMIRGERIPVVSDFWTRPVDWPALDLPIEGVQKFQGLFAVFDIPGTDDANFLAFTAAGNFTVDWGDGVVENVNSGVTAEHEYDYANSNLSAVTSRGYKCAIVTITPNSGNLTSLDFGKCHSTLGTHYYECASWLDMSINGEYLIEVILTSSNIVMMYLLEQIIFGEHAIVNGYYLFKNMYSLQSVPNCDFSSVTTAEYMFYSCETLKVIPVLDISSSTNNHGTFHTCYCLMYVEEIKFPLVSPHPTNTFFYYCKCLEEVGAMNVENSTDVSNFFGYCHALKRLPAIFNLRSAEDAHYMCVECWSLEYVPDLDLSHAADVSWNAYGMFEECKMLEVAPTLALSSSPVDCEKMFSGCINLKTVPAWSNMGNIYISAEMFKNCYSLETLPDLDLSGLLDASLIEGCEEMFYNCYSLREAPDISFPTTVTFSAEEMFYNCYSLEKVPAYNFGFCNTLSRMFYGCNSLQKIPEFGMSNAGWLGSEFLPKCIKQATMPGLAVDVGLSYSMLGPEALNDIYSNLAVVTSQTITVTGNWGTVSDDPGLLPAGWTLVD